MRITTEAMAACGAVSVFLLTSCASGADETASEPTGAVTDEAPDATADTAPEAEASPTPDESEENDSGTVEGAERIPDDQLPVAPSEMYFSAEGEEVGIAGLESHQVIDVFDMPDLSPHVSDTSGDAELLGGVGPLDSLVLAGREVNLLDLDEVDAGHESESTLWAEVQLGQGYGWLQPQNLYYFGPTSDVTGDFEGRVPAAEDPEVLAKGVAIRATIRAETGEVPEEVEDDAEASTVAQWTLVSAPEDFDEEFYRIDITGLPDDSVGGERLFVTVQAGDAGYAVATVESTLLCARGVSDDGLCV